MKDPIVEEVRKIRNSYAKRFDYNLHEISKDIRKRQQASKKRILQPPKRISNKTRI